MHVSRENQLFANIFTNSPRRKLGPRGLIWELAKTYLSFLVCHNNLDYHKLNGVPIHLGSEWLKTVRGVAFLFL